MRPATSLTLPPLLLLAALATPIHAQTGGDEDIGIIHQRLYDAQWAKPFSPEKVRGWLTTLTPDGRWPDIKYDWTKETVRAYSPREHVARCREIARAYVDNTAAGAEFAQNKDVLAKIVLALSDNVGREHAAKFSWDHNWFETYIACPAEYANTLLLLRDSLPKPELTRLAAHLQNGLTVIASNGKDLQFTKGGANLVWISRNTITKGCVLLDPRLIRQGFSAIASTLAIVKDQGEEGMKLDGAFHQHGAQIYSGGYGLWWVADIVASMELAGGTEFASAFTDAQRKIFADHVLGGDQWMSYRKSIDFGATGRNITRVNNTRGMSPAVVGRMHAIYPARTADFRAWAAHLRGGPSSVTGNKHFHLSDFMVHRGPNYYLSAKVLSSRTEGTETMNKENLKGHNLPLGSTVIHTDGEEYTALFPAWDWSRIPGTTAELSATYPSPHTFKGNNPFAGGISDGRAGALAFISSYKDIASRKAYFFLGNHMVCLGSGISASKSNPIVTSLNQAALRGDVLVMTGESQRLAKLEAPELQTTSLRAVHHENVGYVLLSPGSAVVRRGPQTGSWYEINNLFGAKGPVTLPVFSAYLDHGPTPADASYAYAVFPGLSAAEFGPVAAGALSTTVVQNDSKVAALRDDAAGVALMVFYEPGTVLLAPGLTVTVPQPALVLARRADKGWEVSVSDPLATSKPLHLNIDGNHHVSPPPQKDYLSQTRVLNK